MKDKILGAINKGLMNVLSTDIEDQDIDFGNRDIDSCYTPPASLECIRNFGIDYKHDLFEFDTRPYLTLILTDNTEISLHQYTEDTKPLFLKIGDVEMLAAHNEILICMKDKRHYIKGKHQWQNNKNNIGFPGVLTANAISFNDRNAAEKDMTGYKNCIELLKAADEKEVDLPAIKYCRSKSFTNKEVRYEGYLPSLGQFKFINEYFYPIYKTLSRCGQNFINTSYVWWTSTESSDWSVWIQSNRTDTNNKTLKGFVLPLFKKIR